MLLLEQNYNMFAGASDQTSQAFILDVHQLLVWSKSSLKCDSNCVIEIGAVVFLVCLPDSFTNRKSVTITMPSSILQDGRARAVCGIFHSSKTNQIIRAFRLLRSESPSAHPQGPSAADFDIILFAFISILFLVAAGNTIPSSH